jgi:hypothetical protein
LKESPAVRWKKYYKDEWGDLREVEEPGPYGSDVTKYTYDVEHRLTRVEMPRVAGTQVRTFEYNSDDSLKKTVFPGDGSDAIHV